MSRYILSLDQGTTSSRAIVFDRRGDQIAAAQQAVREHQADLGAALDGAADRMFLVDELCSLATRANAEGSVLPAREFAAHVIDRVIHREHIQAAGAALLRLAWHHRDTLLDS